MQAMISHNSPLLCQRPDARDMQAIRSHAGTVRRTASAADMLCEYNIWCPCHRALGADGVGASGFKNPLDAVNLKPMGPGGPTGPDEAFGLKDPEA